MSEENSNSEAFLNRIDDHTVSNIARLASLGKSSLLQENLRKGQPWDVSDNRGWFPIHFAADSGQSLCVKILLEHSEKNFKDTITYNGETPLFLAALNGHDEVMEILLRHGANINVCNNELVSVLVAAIKGKNKNCVKICLNNNVNIDGQDAGGWAAYHEVAFLGDTGLLDLLLSVGGDINVRNNDKATPVFIAAQYGHIDCLNMLIKEHGSVNLPTKDMATPLFIASQEGHIKCVQAVLGANAKVNNVTKDFPTALHTAAERGHLEVIRILIKSGADVNAKSEQGVTPLHLAADEDEVECLVELIESGADIKAELQDDKGTALELAASVGSVKCCEELIKHGSDPNRCFLKNGTLQTTTLMEAIGANESGCVEILLKYGADPNKECYSYPIIAAAKELNPTIISLLLKYGAHVDSADKASNKALDMVFQKITYTRPHNDDQNLVKLECVKLLLKAGADCHFVLTRHSPVRNILHFHFIRRTPVEFVKLLLTFSPNYPEIRKYVECNSFEEEKELMELLGNPRSLLHLCRLKIRQLLGKQRLQKINTLPIPVVMQNYVNFCDL